MENNGHLNDAPYIDRLAALIAREYGIFGVIAPAKRGFYGETWRLDAKDRRYFVKLVSLEFHKPPYLRSLPVIEFLRGQGIDFISRIIATSNGRLYAEFDGAVLAVFDWVDGENAQNERSKLHEYQMLSQIYAVSPQNLAAPRESFSMERASLFFSQWKKLEASPQSETADALLKLFEANRTKIERRANRLSLFSQRCKGDESHFYVTHGDAGGNVLRDGDRYTIVDWDDPVYAPPERDAWFCLHWEWAVRAFNDALTRNGVHYTLRTERLAYYCYHSFFMYLTFYMQIYFELGDPFGNFAEELSGYMNCWIEDNIKYADSL